MIEIIDINRVADRTKLAIIRVKYHEIILRCEVCLYEESHLWVRMPELWLKNHVKMQLIYWKDKADSDAFQKEVLRIFCEKTGLTLERAIEIKKNVMSNHQKKPDTKPKKQEVKPKVIAVDSKAINKPFRTANFKKDGDINKK